LTGDEKGKKGDESKSYGPLDPRAVLAKSGSDVKDLSMNDKLECVPAILSHASLTDENCTDTSSASTPSAG
jgi:hypothetical protein